MSSTTLLNSDLLFLVLLHLAFVSPFFLLSPSHIVLPLTLLARSAPTAQLDDLWFKYKPRRTPVSTFSLFS